MLKKNLIASNLFLAAALVLSGCTVDAQLASQLLSSLQNSIKENTDADGNVSLSAQELASAADAAGVRVVCGGDMSIASVDDDAEPEQALDEAETIHPVLIGYGPGGARRIRIDVALEDELRQLPHYAGPDRNKHFAQIRERFPQMKHARPMPIYGAEGDEVVFGEFGHENSDHCDCLEGPKPAMAPGMRYGGHGFSRPVPPPPQGDFMPGKEGFMKGGKRFMTHPIDGFSDAKGQPCELMANAQETSQN